MLTFERIGRIVITRWERDARGLPNPAEPMQVRAKFRELRQWHKAAQCIVIIRGATGASDMWVRAVCQDLMHICPATYARVRRCNLFE